MMAEAYQNFGVCFHDHRDCGSAFHVNRFYSYSHLHLVVVQNTARYQTPSLPYTFPHDNSPHRPAFVASCHSHRDHGAEVKHNNDDDGVA
ncbi:hypothetical protein A2U01_0073625, partial [Trifolium medium]|nr:hypothetical protein [Trifolium medium]